MVTTDLALQLGQGLSLRRFTIPYGDLSDADTSEAVTLFTLGAYSAILGVRIHHTTAFAGTSVTAMTVSVGSSVVGAAGFASAYDVFQTVGDTVIQESTQFQAGTIAASTVQATFTSTGGDMDVMTAGSVDVEVLIMDVTTP